MKGSKLILNVAEGVINLYMYRVKCCYVQTAFNKSHVNKSNWVQLNLLWLYITRIYSICICSERHCKQRLNKADRVSNTNEKKKTYWLRSSWHCSYLFKQDVLKENKPTLCAYITVTVKFCWQCIIVYPYNETNVMHILFSLLRIKGLYMFRALVAHPQETLNKRHLVYCVRVTPVGFTRKSWCSKGLK
jgi:hypothetical protein